MTTPPHPNRRADDVRLALLEQQFDTLKSDVADIRSDVKRIVQAIDMTRGGWMALAKVGALLLVVAGAIAWLVDHLPMLKKLAG